MQTLQKSISENIQMYLVNIYRLKEDDQPVPVPDLVAEMGITSASVNEMCRKLENEGLIEYIPYSGVILTAAGLEIAQTVLRKHRLWEVFLVGELGYEPREAHQTACMLEHATPDRLAEVLDIFLDRPDVNPDGEPIPGAENREERSHLVSLLECKPGQKMRLDKLLGETAERIFLAQKGIVRGSVVQVLAVDDQSMLITTGQNQVAIAQQIAERILAAPVGLGEQ